MNFIVLGEGDFKATNVAPANNVEKKLNIENHEPMKSSPVKQAPVVQSSSLNAKQFFKQDSLKQPAPKVKSPLNSNNNATLNSSAMSDKNSFNGFKIFTIASLNPYQNK